MSCIWLKTGRTGADGPLRECARCQCTTARQGEKRKAAVTLLCPICPSRPTGRRIQIDSDSRPPSRFVASDPGSVKVSAHRRLKARPARSLGDSSSCLGRRGGSSRLKAAGQWLTALYFRPAPPKKKKKRAPFMCRASRRFDSLSSSAEEPLGFFFVFFPPFLNHIVALGSARPLQSVCGSQTPGPCTVSGSARRSEQRGPLRVFSPLAVGIGRCVLKAAERGDIDPGERKPMS